VNTTTERLDAITARLDADVAAYNEHGFIGDNQCMTDREYLLTLARKQAAALEAVRAACDLIITNADGHKPPGPPHPTREQATACRIRAALEATP